MFYFVKPTGGLYVGKRLQKAPHVRETRAGAPARIVFLTDLHIRRGDQTLLENVAKTVESLQPELLLLGGDVAEYDGGVGLFARRFARISPAYGKFAVSGNNDDQRFNRDFHAFQAEIEAGGFTLLSNDCARAQTKDGARIEIAGVQNSFLRSPCAKGLFSKETAYRILLTHMPLTATLSEAQPAPDLMLAGHTHGGQLNFLGITCYTLIRYEHEHKCTHITGEKRVGSTLCLVSNGVGTSKFPVRFGARPEIHLIR